MKSRSTISLSIFLLFSTLLITGLLMYLMPFNGVVSAIHVFASLLFSIIICLHVLKNLRSLIGYVRNKKSKRFHFTPKSILLLCFIGILCLLGYFKLPPVSTVYNWSHQFKTEDVFYKTFQTNSNFHGAQIAVEVLLDSIVHTPSYAIWLEDGKGNHLQDLYVSGKVATGSFFGPDMVRRPEALPVWSHSRGVKARDGLYVPDSETALSDAISGATPSSNWILNSNVPPNLDSLRVLMEVNQSYDWNDFYHPDAFPEDSIYSGSGRVGQPALVYATKLIDLSEPDVYKMSLIGRAHHSGKDGYIRKDVDRITTARKIIKRILIEVH